MYLILIADKPKKMTEIEKLYLFVQNREEIIKKRDYSALECCPECDDGDGNCIYPQYGSAPHKCYWKIWDGKTLGTSQELPQSEWPKNFIPETEPNPGGYPGTGIYTHCLNCGRGK